MVKKVVPVTQADSRSLQWWSAPRDDSGLPQLRTPEDVSWYSPEISPPLSLREKRATFIADAKKLEVITSAVILAFEREVSLYQNAKGSKLSGDQKWVTDVLKSGTISDRVAALALVVQESPIHELSALDALLAMASRKEYRTSQLALEALKDLLIHNLLPDRRLVPFKSQPLLHPEMTMQRAMSFWYEEQLMNRMEVVVIALEVGLKSNIEYFKKQCMDIAADLLMGKPERESKFLEMLVNKLGDPSGAVGSKCIELLRNVVRNHPAMKGIIVREVRQLIYRPNLGVRVVHSGIIFLSQVPLVRGDHDVAAQLVECYMSLFEKAVKQDELGSRLLSSLLSGLDRAFPYLDNKEPIAKHVDSLFRIVHSASFTTTTRALMLISHIALSDTTSSSAGEGSKVSTTGNDKKVNVVSIKENHLISRFYRSLYSTLLSPQIGTRAYNTLFMNLLFRSMKRDPSDLRVMAFLKRLGICALTSSAPITAGLLFLTAEVYRARPNLLVMLTSEERLVAHGTIRDGKEQYDDDDGEDSTASHQLGNFEASKREPSFAVSGTPAMWETSLLRNHFHPSVRSFSTSVLEAPHLINFAGDPTTEFSLSAFLNRFAYKNPKKQHSEKMRRPQPTAEEPLNAASFLKSSLSEVAPDKIFFHKFFGEKAKLLAEGKSRDRSKRKKHDGDDEGDESDGDDDGVDFDEKAIDKYATKLAEDMLRDNEDDADIDDDFSDFDDDVEDKEDFSIGSASDEDELDGEEDFNGSETLKGGKEDAYDSEGDSEGDSLFSEEEEDDLALAFSEGGPTSKNGAKAKKTRGKRNSEEMSDFASAEDYEETMEQIVDRFSNGFDRPNERVPISDVAIGGGENKKRKNSKFVPVVGQKIKNLGSKKMKAK